MDRLGIYIIVFFLLGLTFFERVRTKRETGGFWKLFFRNLIIIVLSAAAFFFWGMDVMYPGLKFEWFATADSIIHYQPPYGEAPPGHRTMLIMDTLRQCLFCSMATLIVAAGIWELNLRRWKNWILTAIFSLLIYPLFGQAHWGNGFLLRAGFYDFHGAILIWALPAAYVLGVRLCVSKLALPDERKHDLSEYKILPGMKHRFFLSRGIGMTMIFLVLNATTLEGHSWVISKTLTLIPASLTVLFCNFFFFGLFGKKETERTSYAPPLLAIMAALVGTQACELYNVEQVIIASVATTFVTLLYLRIVPLNVRVWDPICSLPVFLVGGIMGALMASMTEPAEFLSQCLGVGVCLLYGTGGGIFLTFIMRLINEPAVEAIISHDT